MPDTHDRLEHLRRAVESSHEPLSPYAVRELFRQRDALLAAAERVVLSLRHGLRAIEGQGVGSFAFQSRADETAAAIQDLKAIIVDVKRSSPEAGEA